MLCHTGFVSAQLTRLGESLESCLHVTLATSLAALTGASIDHDDVIQCKVLDGGGLSPISRKT